MVNRKVLYYSVTLCSIRRFQIC